MIVAYLSSPLLLHVHQSHYGADSPHVNTQFHTDRSDAFAALDSPPDLIPQVFAQYTLADKLRVLWKWAQVGGRFWRKFLLPGRSDSFLRRFDSSDLLGAFRVIGVDILWT